MILIISKSDNECVEKTLEFGPSQGLFYIYVSMIKPLRKGIKKMKKTKDKTEKENVEVFYVVHPDSRHYAKAVSITAMYQYKGSSELTYDKEDYIELNFRPIQDAIKEFCDKHDIDFYEITAFEDWSTEMYLARNSPCLYDVKTVGNIPIRTLK